MTKTANPKQVTKMIKGKELTGTYVDEKTIIIEGIGKVTKVGELDLGSLLRMQ
jgi:hypothetical protein